MDPVIHFEIPAADLDRAKKFYEKVFGWMIEASYPTYYKADTTENDIRGFSATKGVINGALQLKDNSIRMPRIVIKVTDIDESIQRALKEGATIFIPRTRLPRFIYCVLYDPEGNEINIMQEIK